LEKIMGLEELLAKNKCKQEGDTVDLALLEHAEALFGGAFVSTVRRSFKIVGGEWMCAIGHEALDEARVGLLRERLEMGYNGTTNRRSVRCLGSIIIVIEAPVDRDGSLLRYKKASFLAEALHAVLHFAGVALEDERLAGGHVDHDKQTEGSVFGGLPGCRVSDDCALAALSNQGHVLLGEHVALDYHGARLVKLLETLMAHGGESCLNLAFFFAESLTEALLIWNRSKGENGAVLSGLGSQEADIEEVEQRL